MENGVQNGQRFVTYAWVLERFDRLEVKLDALQEAITDIGMRVGLMEFDMKQRDEIGQRRRRGRRELVMWLLPVVLTMVYIAVVVLK